MTTTRFIATDAHPTDLQDHYSAREVVKVAIASACAGIVLMGLITLALTANYTPAPSTMTLPECATEDSYNCIWDAEKHGNGEGRSFITIGDEDNFTIYLQN